MKIKNLLCPIVGVLSACGVYAQQKPHIILIMSDQHRADAIGCSGNETIYTPNIDALAKEGNLFSSAYSSVPSSTPARAALLTGMSTWGHGMLGYGKQAERYEYEMPRMMSELGYNTLGIGKMHWSPQSNLRGFDVMLLDESGRRETPNFISDYHKWFAINAAGLNPDSTGIGWNDHGASVYALDENLHPTYWTGQSARSAIASYESDEPLFLKVSFARPHSPYDPPQRVYDMVKKNMKSPLEPVVGDWVSEQHKTPADPNANLEAAVGNFGVDYAVNSRLHYNAAITFIDEQVGAIVDELKAKGMYDNSLILFISDHGDMMGDHHLWRKTYAYEGSAKIPFVVKLPSWYKSSVSEGKNIEYPIELRDILPTFIDIAGGEQPQKMDGSSLLEIYDNKKPEWRKYIDLEHATCYFDNNYWCALTDGKIKYIRFIPTGQEQLFDLVSDPGEINDLSGDKKHQDMLESMRAAMVEHLSPRGDKWVKDGEIVVRKQAITYGDNFPKKNN